MMVQVVRTTGEKREFRVWKDCGIVVLDLPKAESENDSDGEDAAMMEDDLKDEEDNCEGETRGGRDLKETENMGTDSEEEGR